MLTASISRAPPRARLLQANRSSAAIRHSTIPSTAAFLQSRSHDVQTRHFRFGRWPSCRRYESPQEIRGRHRGPKYRYMESISRSMTWSQHPGGNDPQAAIKKLLARYWNTSGATNIANRYVDMEKLKSWSDELSGARPGRNIEDVERNAINHLFHQNSNQGSTTSAATSRTSTNSPHDPWTSAFQHIRNYMASQRSFQARQEQKTTQPPAACADDTVSSAAVNATRASSTSTIDPITNRRRQAAETSPSVTDEFASVSSSVAHFALPHSLRDDARQPVYSDGPPSAKELQRYAQVEIDDQPWVEPDQMAAPLYDDLHTYGPVMNAELETKTFGNPHDPPPQPRSQSAKDDLSASENVAKYGPVQWNEPDGLPELTAEEKSKQYNDLAKYGKVRWNEPNGLPELTAEEKSKQYTDLHKYGPVQWREPDGLPELTAEEKSKSYRDLNKYGPMRWMEPDGLPNLTAEERSKFYQDLDRYGPVKWQEPDGLPELTAEEKSKQYEDLDQYGPISWNEPDGMLPVDREALARRYAKLDKFGPMLWEEQDQVQPPPVADLAKEYGDLHQYSKPVHWNEPDGLPGLTAEEKSKEYTDLGDYQPVRWNEPNGQLPPTAEEKSKQYDDLDKYQPVRWNEPDGKPPPSAEERSKKYDDLEKFNKGVRWNEPNGKPPLTQEEKSKQYGDLHQYRAVRWNEPDGLPALHPEEASKQYTDLRSYDKAFRHDEGFDDMTARLKGVDQEMSSYGHDWDASAKSARATVQQSKIKSAEQEKSAAPQRFTGQYTKDFPEDFAVSWSSLLEQSSVNNAQEIIAGEAEASSFDESFPRRAADDAVPKIQPALDRTPTMGGRSKIYDQTPASVDFYSKEPQGMETSFMEECGGRATMPVLMKTYGATSAEKAAEQLAAAAATAHGPLEGEKSKEAQSPDSGRRTPTSPSRYKILAYDDILQTVSSVDATSGVYDSAEPMPLPEILKQLSSPAKFFPHLKPLELQGYDMICGSKDMIVFRKVRDGEDAATVAAASPPKPRPYQPARVNPIDMMGSDPVTPHAYSASPTGYVNYEEVEADSQMKPLPPNRYAFSRHEDGSPEAPVDEQSHGAPPKRRGSGRVKKVLAGAATVGGLSYAFGVVGEFFKTGGTEGNKRSTRF